MKIPQPAQQGADSSSSTPISASVGFLPNDVQRSLTVAKKADVRIRRLQEERVRRTTQWELFMKKTKSDFMEQQKQFQQDLQRIQSDIDAATTTGREASEVVKQLVLYGAPQTEADDSGQAAAWDELMKDEDEEHAAAPGFFQDALQAASYGRQAAMNPHGGMMTAEAAARLLAAAMAHLPQVGDMSGPAGPQPAYGTGPPAPHPEAANVASTQNPSGTATHPAPPPYIPSPSHPGAVRPPMGLSPQPGGPSPGKKQRVPVKGAPLQPVHTAGPGQMQDRLNAKRHAMRPFRQAPSEHHAEVCQEGEVSLPEGANQPPAVIPDDGDQDLSSPKNVPPQQVALEGMG